MRTLFSNLNEKAKFPDRIRYIVIDNANGKNPSVASLTEMGLPLKIYPNDTEGKRGSFGHASGLNEAMKKLETEFAVGVDPDIYVFKDDWDCFCIEELKTRDCSAIGTTYPQWQLGKYHNFPNPVFCFFRTKDYKMMDSDWTPYWDSGLMTYYNFIKRQVLRCGIFISRKRYEKYPLIRKISTFLEGIIGVCSHDTGWRIADKARQKHIRSVVFQAVLPDDTVTGSQTDAFRQLAGEFELYYCENEPILTHKYSTASRVWRTGKGGDLDFWRECIKQFENNIVNSEAGE